MTVDSYLTIDRELGDGAEAMIEVKRSRFLGRLARVETEAGAREFIAACRAEHPDARHHCTAFILGPDAMLRRSNDDSEPSGTAGRPMLDTLSGSGVSDVVAVVTRWFGGTLLGAGGLARAYGGAVSAALAVAGSRRRVRRTIATVRVPLAEAGAVEHRLRALSEVRQVTYGAHTELIVAVAEVRTLDRLEVVASELGWVDEPDG